MADCAETTPYGTPVHAILGLLSDRYPDYAWWVDAKPDGPRYTAVAYDLATRPTCVVSDDPAEFRQHLGESVARGAGWWGYAEASGPP